MIKKMRYAFAALLAAALGSLVLATPAHAEPWDCPAERICLWQAQNAAQERWQSTISNLVNSPNGCINLTSPMAYWTNGTKVTDNTGSMVINGKGAWGGYQIGFFDWVNCNTNGGILGFYGAGGYHYDSNLSTLMSTGVPAYHRITSIGAIF